MSTLAWLPRCHSRTPARGSRALPAGGRTPTAGAYVPVWVGDEPPNQYGMQPRSGVALRLPRSTVATGEHATAVKLSTGSLVACWSGAAVIADSCGGAVRVGSGRGRRVGQVFFQPAGAGSALRRPRGRGPRARWLGGAGWRAGPRGPGVRRRAAGGCAGAWLGAGQLAGEQQPLGPGEQVVSDAHQREPDLVVGEVAEGQVA